MPTDIMIPRQARIVALEQDYEPQLQLKKGLRQGLILVAVLVFGLGGLAAILPMISAVVAVGSVAVANFVKPLGHPTGGVIAQVLVHDGDHVTAGQQLLVLDNTVSKASAQYSGESVDQLLARSARLRAERDNQGSVVFPSELTQRAGDPNVAALMAQEQKTFILRRQSRVGLVAQMQQRIAAAHADAAGYATQAASYRNQATLIDEELKSTRELYENRYTTLDRLNALERSAVGLRANADSAQTSAASAQARIGELEAQIGSVSEDARSQSAAELMDVLAKISNLQRDKAVADDAYGKSVLRAPQPGTIDKLAFKTIGGIVPPNETILEIVPDHDSFVVEVRIPLTDIDQVHEGQEAALRFSSFSSRTTPEIAGKVTHVAADRTVEPQNNVAYYRATISLSPDEIRRLGAVTLKPGMPVEAFIQTGSRTMLSYIMKPLADQLRRAFLEK